MLDETRKGLVDWRCLAARADGPDAGVATFVPEPTRCLAGSMAGCRNPRLGCCRPETDSWKRGPGSGIVNTTSINVRIPSPTPLVDAITKGAIANFTAGRRNWWPRRHPGEPRRVWPYLDAADPVTTKPEQAVETFAKNAPLGHAGQPAELAPAQVRLASDEASYITGALLPVTLGRLML
jgi:NAD(P)-dependent dehydrogenase (short-subunit alcohol dehydrogenase family)